MSFFPTHQLYYSLSVLALIVVHWLGGQEEIAQESGYNRDNLYDPNNFYHPDWETTKWLASPMKVDEMKKKRIQAPTNTQLNTQCPPWKYPNVSTQCNHCCDSIIALCPSSQLIDWCVSWLWDWAGGFHIKHPTGADWRTQQQWRLNPSNMCWSTTFHWWGWLTCLFPQALMLMVECLICWQKWWEVILGFNYSPPKPHPLHLWLSSSPLYTKPSWWCHCHAYPWKMDVQTIWILCWW